MSEGAIKGNLETGERGQPGCSAVVVSLSYGPCIERVGKRGESKQTNLVPVPVLGQLRVGSAQLRETT